MAGENERDNERRHEVLISDKRHSREIDTAKEGHQESASTSTEPEPAAGHSGKTSPADEGKSKPPVDTQPPPAVPETEAHQPPLEDVPETAQLRMLFEAGLPVYLHSQLQLLLNFAMIYLGRQPNPANGLVSTDLDNARLSIDLFEFIVKRTQGDLPEQDRAGLSNLVSSLKMEFAQVAQSATKPPSGEES